MYDIRIFCENIKKIRENKKLSKREMAKLLGISVYSLNIIESGKVPHRLSIDIVYNINSSFGISPNELRLLTNGWYRNRSIGIVDIITK